MNLEQLQDELQYTEANPAWINLRNMHDMSDHILYQAKQAGVCGVYSFVTTPEDTYTDDQLHQSTRHAVYVAKATNPTTAREIHKKVWNIGSSPFLIVILPYETRIYKGFSYHPKNEQDDTIISSALSQFHAHAIDTGQLWISQQSSIDTSGRVDQQLLRSLSALEKQLTSDGYCLSTQLAHALIGKFIYIHYLMARDIVTESWLADSNITLEHAIGRQATKDGFLRLLECLDDRFNGHVFPLPDTSSIDDDIVQFVSRVFKGDDVESGQLTLDFDVYDFTYIPIETLSIIYEQFLHATDKGRSNAAYYTSEPLAENLLSQISFYKPICDDVAILDPCCGSGIFLVLAYRKLIQNAIAAKGSLSPDELCSILKKSIYGVERDEDACSITEFSLLLTLLSYIQPEDTDSYKEFRFPVLRDRNVFCQDFFDHDRGFWMTDKAFDIIIGNPPWKEIEYQRERESEKHVIRWIEKSVDAGIPIARGRIHDAFTIHISERLKPDGYMGLVTQATTLTDGYTKPFRAYLFHNYWVVSITNLTHLKTRLFSERANYPAATIIYTHDNSSKNGCDIIHCAPTNSTQLTSPSSRKQLWSIIINESDVQYIPYSDAIDGRMITWKLALWGTYLDKRAITELSRQFELYTIADLCSERGWAQPAQGMQFRSADANDALFEPELVGMMKLNLKKVNGDHRFVVPDECLYPMSVTECYRRRRGRNSEAPVGLSVVKAPHIYIGNNTFLYSDRDFVLPHPKIGIAAPAHDENYLRALSVYLNSCISKYLLFFNNPLSGISFGSVGLSDIKSLCIPRMSDNAVRQLSAYHLAKSGSQGKGKAYAYEVQKDIDAQITEVFDIPDDITLLAQDLCMNRYTNIDKADTCIRKHDDLQDYTSSLAKRLNDFIGIPQAVHVGCHIETTTPYDFIMCKIGLSHQQLLGSDLHNIDISDSEIDRVRDLVTSSQWVYGKRALRVIEGDQVKIIKKGSSRNWTKVQALLDADDTIAELISI